MQESNNYLMVGAGGTGTHLLGPLVTYLKSLHADNFMLHVVDGDVVEPKNLERQAFLPGTITMNKAEAALMPFKDDPRMKAYPEYLSEENLNRFIQDRDTVLLCVDNFTVRRHIEDYARTLPNLTVINGGNEKTDGSIQLWVRENGEDLTPRIGYLHPELKIATGDDRAAMTCVQAAALPGGEQTIIANLQSATWMLTALWRAHQNLYRPIEGIEPKATTWTELQYDVVNGTVEHIDQRMSAHWRTA